MQFRYFCTFATDKSNIQLMTLVIITIILIGYFLIATEKFTNVNKAAVAIFVGTLGWILYICYGSDLLWDSTPRTTLRSWMAHRLRRLP